MITSVEKRIPLQTGLYLFNFHWQNCSIFGGNIHPEYYVADFGTSYTLLSRIQQMKSQIGFDRQRNWSEEGKTGRLLILFVGLILSSYVRHI